MGARLARGPARADDRCALSRNRPGPDHAWPDVGGGGGHPGGGERLRGRPEGGSLRDTRARMAPSLTQRATSARLDRITPAEAGRMGVARPEHDQKVVAREA